jgi:hypothetical protein
MTSTLDPGGVARRVWAHVSALAPHRVRLITWSFLALPFVIAAIRLLGREYHPVLDLAMTEFRVRDVGTGDTPLIGLPGRIGVFPDQGSHPGPLSFYLIAPTYRLLGSSAWGLLVGMIVLNLVAIAAALWLANRRGGTPLTVAIAGVIVLLVRGYGLEVMTQPWNPYLPLLFWLVLLLATWSVLDGDRRMIVVVTAAGSLCAQTHMPYLGLSLGMGALCVAALVRQAVQHPVERNEVSNAIGTSLVVGLVLWAPPVYDQLTNDPGNLRMIADYFGHAPEDPVGLGEGVRLLLRHLDVFRIVGGAFGADGYVTRAGFDLRGSVIPGAIVLLVWVTAAAMAWRLRHRLLNTLNVVIGWSMVLAVVSMSRIFGKVWYYLTLWAWTTTMLVAVSVVWTVAVVVRSRMGDRNSARPRIAIASVAAIAVLGSYGALTVEAFGARVPEQHLSDTLRAITEPTATALADGVGAATGRDGTYVVTWNDASNFGSQGYGLVNELERRGFHVGVPFTWRVPVTIQRVVTFGEADAEVRLATGSYIEEVSRVPGAELVIEYDPRDAAERAEYDELSRSVTSELQAAGLDELVPLLDTNLFGVQLDTRVSTEVQAAVDRMLQLGTPTAVFVLPSGADQ